MSFNAYNDTPGGWKYKSTDQTGMLTIDTTGSFIFQTAVSGAANSAITWQNRLTLTTDGRLYGNALHNSAGVVTGTTNQYIASGTYTPTFTNLSNIFSTSAVGTFKWIRVGNVVHVTGRATPTFTAGSAQLGISLPIASNLASAGDCNGVATANASTSGAGSISGDTTNDRATVDWAVTSVSSPPYAFTFSYEVL